jgi:hypothetical protein
MTHPGVARARKRTDEIDLPFFPQQPVYRHGVMDLNEKVNNGFWTLTQQSGQMPEVARLKKKPERRSAAGSATSRA